MSSRGVEVIDSRGCSKVFIGIPGKAPSLSSSQAQDWMSRRSVRGLTTRSCILPRGPFVGLIICVTGLSKEARNLVMEETWRLGGEYSPNLHPQCTHLVVQSCGGRKFEHALKHGSRNGLFVVTLGWFVDSVRRNVRLCESMYKVTTTGENLLPLVELNRLVGHGAVDVSCLPATIHEESRPYNGQPNVDLSPKENRIMNNGALFVNESIYVDPHIPTALKKKIVGALVQENAKILDFWFAGCSASYVVCEGPQVQKYVGHVHHLVTPAWILKSIVDKKRQRLVQLSTDLAREVALILEDSQGNHESSANFREHLPRGNVQDIAKERKNTIDWAKMCARTRRLRRMQSWQTPRLPITPNKILDSICWSISEPTSSASTYTIESCIPEDAENNQSVEGETTASTENQVRLLKESEKTDIVFRGHFLTILFPIDQSGELGPSSRTFFSDGGFSCIQVLDHIHSFYQENMTSDEVVVAIHTDSRCGDRLRSIFASEEAINHGFVPMKRIDFLGSRKSFEMLKRVSSENCNVFELVLQA